MKYGDVIRAYRAIGELKALKLPFRKARAVYEAAKQLETEYAFYAEQERIEVNEYAQKGADGKPIITGSRITFASGDDARDYTAAIHTLNETEVQADIKRVTLSDYDIADGSITAEAIDALTIAGIVVFE